MVAKIRMVRRAFRFKNTLYRPLGGMNVNSMSQKIQMKLDLLPNLSLE